VGLGAAIVGFCLIAACSGSSSNGIGGSSDAGADGAAQSAYTLDDVCEKVAPKICAMRKSCCQDVSTYDEAGCIAHEKTECGKDVADVRAGRATFHPDDIDGCLVKLQPFFDTCYLTFDLLYRVAELLETCRVFEGKLAEGAACERDSQCTSAPGAFAGCDKDSKTCKLTRFFAEGEACSLGANAGGFCGKGLYCDADLGKNPPTGTCKKATPLGSACNAANPVNLECGLGSYCEKTTKVCTAGKTGGAPCASDLECASISCAGGSGSAKTCKPTQALVSPEQCKGP
jgi:hypothetical protein